MVITRNQWTARSWEKAPRGHYLSIALVALLHVGLIYTLLIVLGVQPAPFIIGDAQIIPTVPPAPPPLQTPIVRDQIFKQSVVSVPMPQPLPNVTYGPDAPTASVIPEAPTKETPAVALPAPVPAVLARVAARIDLAHSTKPAYPPLSRRLLEEGTVIVRVLVGAQGNVVDATVDTSSGHPRLDAAALDGVRHGYRFSPATEGGHPVETWQRIAVTFHLSDRD